MLARQSDVPEEDFIVSIETTIPTLRLMYQCAHKAHETWPGGNPQEQEDLELLKHRLYSALMDALLGSGNL